MVSSSPSRPSTDLSSKRPIRNCSGQHIRCTHTARLRELQDEGIVERRVHPETPVRVKWVLTTKG
ncbi:MAG: winged helix-turn-helix transcriptional regulator [Mycobacteriaceae bacterium]